MSKRYAIYFVPGDTTPLGEFGSSVLGRDANGDGVKVPNPEHALREQLTKQPAHYGFHATLKPPFELARGKTFDSLISELADFSARQYVLELPGLAPRQMAGFCALALPESDNTVNSLAARCVTHFEPWRAALSTEEIDRRKPAQLGARPRQLLEKYGYPYVLDEFRFHMTLSSAVTSDSNYLDWLQAAYRQSVTSTPSLDRLALCCQATRQHPFRRLGQWLMPQNQEQPRSS